MDIASQLLLANRPLSSNPDPYWNNVVLYLKGDGTNGSTNIIDSSNSAKTVTIQGTGTISTAQFKYGGSSIDLTSTNSHLIVTGSTDFDFPSDFTIETWIYFNSIIQTYLFDARNPSNSYLFDSLGGIRLFINPSTNLTGSFTATTNQWYHMAVSRNSGTVRLFVDGTQIGTNFTNTTSIASNQTNCRIGGDYTGGNRSICYFDSFRITKGVGRYTSNFNTETDTYLS